MGSQAGFASEFGYQEGSESGLKLLGHWYYDPGTGRFITRDPIMMRYTDDSEKEEGAAESQVQSWLSFQS
jgi:hypothetical protein